jgi:hypothetical protein
MVPCGGFLWGNKAAFMTTFSRFYRLMSNLTSDQIIGIATNPPRIIPIRAVSTADPGMYTATR